VIGRPTPRTSAPWLARVRPAASRDRTSRRISRR
jgi:hypothetical protein